MVLNTIGVEAEINGYVYSLRPTLVNGKVVGEIISKKEITIGESGEVLGNIKTQNLTIKGKFRGNIVVSREVRITSTGKLFGNLICKNPKFIIDKGGFFDGKRISVENEEIFEINGFEKIKDIEIKVKKIYDNKEFIKSDV